MILLSISPFIFIQCGSGVHFDGRRFHTGKAHRPIEGRGIAATLVKAAYDYALANGMKPKATCSYAVRWLERHPELDKG